MLSTHDLAALIAVADGGSIHRAASVLGRTQPTVTQAIQRLEDAVGFTLLDRSGYRVRLTERGEIFLKRARATVKQCRDLQAFATVLAHGVEARLRLALHGAIASSAWLPLVEHIAGRFPDTVLELQTGEGDAPLRRLLDDECDLAMALSATPGHKVNGTEHKLLGEIEFVCVAHASHAKTSDDLAVPPHDLSALPQIVVADFDDAVASFGVVEGHRYWRVSDHRAKTAAIVAGIGWGSVPASLVEAELRAGTLHQVTYRGLGPTSRWPFFLYKKSERALGPAAASIWETAAAEDDRPAQST